MKSPFRRTEHEQPILAPLGRPRALARFRAEMAKLPAAAAPVLVTVVGGVALVVVLAMLMGDGGGTASRPQPDLAAAASADPEPDIAAPPAPEPDTAVADSPPPPPAPPRVETAQLLPDVPADTGREVAAELDPDPARTASILSGLRDGAATAPATPPVPVAETDEEIAELERAQREEVEADVGAPPPEAAAPADMRKATATRYVNMRAGPDDDAEVLTVVPALAEIEAEDDCNWCAVVYEGRSGYIYRSFISYAD